MQRKNGLVHVLTGDGNGKTTSAVGIMCRAASRGMKVAFIQFLKGGLSSEIPSLQKLGVEVVTRTKYCPKQAIHESQLAEKGAVIYCRDCFVINARDKPLVLEAFEKAKAFSSSGKFGLVVLDEIFWAMKEKLVKEEEVLELIESRSSGCELILTGRGATPAIEDAADYVTYVNKGKHPFDKGTLSRCGIDY